MRDFTLHNYKLLCLALKKSGYQTITLADYCAGVNHEKYVILRHDVDKDPPSALKMAVLENQLRVKASYYFRIVDASYDEDIIMKIGNLDHEIGYHYEDLSAAGGSPQIAIETFKANLSKLRQLCLVQTICMHGSPLSKWDNRLLWKHHDYRDFGIIGEPYFDINFDEVLYLTDTGRSWNSVDSNMRDKVQSKFNYALRSTIDIMEALHSSDLPDRLMLNIHPQRWHDHYLPWLKELVWQNTKNVGKRILAARK